MFPPSTSEAGAQRAWTPAPERSSENRPTAAHDNGHGLHEPYPTALAGASNEDGHNARSAFETLVQQALAAGIVDQVGDRLIASAYTTDAHSLAVALPLELGGHVVAGCPRLGRRMLARLPIRRCVVCDDLHDFLERALDPDAPPVALVGPHGLGPDVIVRLGQTELVVHDPEVRARLRAVLHRVGGAQ